MKIFEKTWVVASVAAVVTSLSVVTTAHAEPELVDGDCPALFALGVQGTGQSSPDASPTTDTGMLSSVFMPLLANAGDLVSRAYVPYEAGFGGAVPGGNVPYSTSVSGAESGLDGMAAEIAARCPQTRFAAVGYSQGAHAVSIWAQQVAAGGAAIPADKLVGVALFADPTRPEGASLFPGAPGQTSPQPVPGTSGTEVSQVVALDQPPAEGGGIGPVADVGSDYGSLTGRVASFCTSGDLACDAPAGAPIVRVVSNIAGQSELSSGDPIRSLTSIAEALAMTTIKTVVPVINEDIQGTTLANLQLSPQQSLSQRLATASDPRTPLPDANDAISALMKVGTIGLNAAISVAKEVITPATIAELATVGMSNPLAAAGILGTKLLGAVVKLVPPASISRLVNQAFQVVQNEVTDNAELLDLNTLVKYANTVASHNSYGSTPATPGGASPVQFVIDWYTAAARDIAAAGVGG